MLTHQNRTASSLVAFIAFCVVPLMTGCNSFSSGSSSNTIPPTAPTNLVATMVSPAQINLSWTASTDNVGVTGYKVERCSGAACANFTQIATPTATSYNDTGLSGSTSYSYRVRATDAAGNLSMYSAPTTTATPAPTLAAPSGLAVAAASSTQINLTWTASTETGGTISGYLVERCSGAGCSNFAQIATPAGTTYNDTGLAASTSYSYRVRATDASSNMSTYSNTASSTTAHSSPSAPANLSASAAGPVQINLSWAASAESGGTISQYLIERCQGPGCSGFAQVGTSPTTSFSDTRLTGSTSYSYRVRASDTLNNLGPYSSTTTAATAAPTLTAPTGLTATTASPVQINLSWTASTETGGTISKYLIERCSGAGCNNFAQVGTSTTTSFNDTALVGSTSYSYRVRATDAANNLSAYSSTATATTSAPILTAPSNLSATAVSTSQINLAWSASTETGGTISGYLLERCSGAGCSNFAQIATPTTTSYNDTSLTAFTSYSYRVRATDASNDLSPYSNTASSTTSHNSPSAPTSLTATAAGPVQINLSWTASTEQGGTISQYLIERCQGTGCANFAQVGTSTTTTFNNGGLTASTSYTYRVRASDTLNNLGPYSSTATAATTVPTLTAPTGLTATTASPVQINLSWTASTETGGTISKYLVERCTGAGCSNFSQVGTSTTTSFNDTSLLGSTSYTYRVRATDAANNLSPYSATATATTPAPILTAPSNLSATAVASSQINLTWTASTETGGTISGYLLERCSGAGCSNFAQIATPTTTSYNDTGLIPSTSYSYRVRATDALGNLSPYSSTATASTPVSSVVISISPLRAAVTTTQPQTFSATVTGSTNTSVTWSVDAILNGNTTVGTISASGTYTPPSTAGTHTISATSVADITKSASASIAVTDLTGVTTYHNDLSRDGANTHEFALTNSIVNSATFGKLFSCTLDGAIYAQPLWVSNLTINGAKHNVILVATQHNSVYAFDADTSPCVTLWQAKLTDSTHGGTAGETTVPSGPTGNLVGAGFGDITPEVGVTGTPVIDPATNTLYVVSKSVIASGPTFFQRLHALDLTTGSEKFGGPVSITNAITFPGNFSGGTTVAFDPRTENQRPGLALVNGVVYISWAAHEDQDQYHGWVIGYNASTLALVPNAIFNTTPNIVNGAGYARGGIWMGGGAPAADSSFNLYFLTGNGTFDASSAGSNYGDSTVKLSTAAGLSVSDWFTPADQSNLDGNDTDHGSGGAAILINLPAGNFVIGGGKEGNLFLLNCSSMGHYGANANPVNSNAAQIVNVGGGIFATSAFWNNSLYITPSGGNLQAFPLNTTTGLFTAGSATSTTTSFGFPGATPSISSSGTTNGIVWATDSSQYCTNQSPGCGPAVLHAYSATALNTELWNSSMVAGDAAGFAVKFTVPTVANGKVYIGTRGNDNGAGTSTVRGELDVYGLKPN
jgi:fibronectin type 3 domain-containing protein